MKKIVLMIAVVTAMIVNGASLDWTSGSNYLMDKENNKATAYANGGQVVLALLGTDLENFSDATVLQRAQPGTSGKATGKVQEQYSFVYGSGRSSGELFNGDILTVLYENKDKSLQKLLVAGSDTEMYTTYNVSGIGDDRWSGTTYNFATSNFQEPVPEPTSGLLLLVGASLLALRRKQK